MSTPTFPRLLYGIAAFVVTLFVASAAAGTDAQEPTAPTLYLESGAGAVGSEVATTLLVRMPSAGSATVIEVLLTFDPLALAFERLETGSVFETGTARPGQPGEVILLVSSGVGCQPNATCQAGTLYWQALAEGVVEIRLQEVTVLGGNEAIPGVAAVGAVAAIGPIAGQPPGVVPSTDDATLGLGNAAILGSLVVLLGVAIVAPFALVGLRRRRNRQQRVSGAVDHEELFQLAARYLDDIQAAGSVDEAHPDVEFLARAHSNKS